MAYAIGVDFGTESARVLLLDLDTGREAGGSVVAYPHGVMDGRLWVSGENLPRDWALQDPDDYVYALQRGIGEALRGSGIDSGQVAGLGIDFTACTVLPVQRDGTPLCRRPEFRNRPHAWVKLWKHHAAQPVADRINTAAVRTGQDFLKRYGGRISSEWYFPKLIEVFEQDPEVYHASDAFIEAADWIVWYLTGVEKRNSCTAGYKAMWSIDAGLADSRFFHDVNPDFIHPGEKLGSTFYPLGTRAGYLRPEVAQSLGLSPAVAVAVGNVDAHVCVPGVGVSSPGALVMVVGTSICHLTLTRQEVLLPGITGVVKDGILPGFFGYEAGQAAVGDMLAWYVERAVPEEYHRTAKEEGISVYEHLERLAAGLAPGSSGLVALDWWNGNRSILGDADLSGVLVGLTQATTPPEIYRALVESIAFGTRSIVDNFGEHGIALTELVATGGIAWKSPLLMQIYADVCGLPVKVYESREIPARGAALFGAVAVGKERGGFAGIEEAVSKLRPPLRRRYDPDPVAGAVYARLYGLYRALYDWFGRERVELLHELKSLGRRSSQKS